MSIIITKEERKTRRKLLRHPYLFDAAFLAALDYPTLDTAVAGALVYSIENPLGGFGHTTFKPQIATILRSQGFASLWRIPLVFDVTSLALLGQ